MSDYAYAYPTDYTDGGRHLPPHQLDLYVQVRKEAAHTGEDCADVLRRAQGGNDDEAAVADALGGPGAGDGYRP